MGGISISDMLINMNRKISVLYDREHTIGHAYFIPLRDAPSVENLADIFEYKILPLLQEYFYDDYGKIRLVLGDNRKADAADQFIIEEKIDSGIFGDRGNQYIELDNECLYRVNRDAFKRIEAYQNI